MQIQKIAVVVLAVVLAGLGVFMGSVAGNPLLSLGAVIVAALLLVGGVLETSLTKR